MNCISINTFEAMKLFEMSETIGISENILEKALKHNIRSYKLRTKIKHINFLMEKITNITDDNEFINRLYHKLSFIIYYGTYSLKNNIFKGKYLGNNAIYELEILIGSNCIEFKSNNGKTKSMGKYKKNKHSSYIIYETEKNQTYKFDGKDSLDIEKIKTIIVFNKSGTQDFEYTEKTEENYYVDKGKKILHNPNVFKNFIEKQYKWRETKNIILGKFIRQYKQSSEFLINIDNLLIGKNIDPNNKRLQSAGNYVWYDPILYQEYKNGIISIDDIWKHKGQKLKKKQISSFLTYLYTVKVQITNFFIFI